MIDCSICANYKDFTVKIFEIEKKLLNKREGTITFEKILEFLEANQTIFIQETRAAIPLNSLGIKVRHLAGYEPLVVKLRSYVEFLIPSDFEKIKNFMEHMKSTIVDFSQLNNAFGSVYRIGYFAIGDEEARAEIAKISAQKVPRYTAEYIRNFAIQNESTRVEIAKLCAKHDGTGTAYHIKNFDIENESTRVEIAKLCAQHDGAGTAYHIKNFDIENESTRVEIAKLCVKQNVDWTVELIQKFSIRHEPTRIAIAKICAEKAGRCMAKYIKEYDIGDVAARIEIAKLCAQQDGRGTAIHIKNFDIENESVKFDIVKLCAEQNALGTMGYFSNFDIKDELIRVEVAKLCAKQDPTLILGHIRNFDFKNDWAKLEIARLCAKKNGGYTALYIQHFGIRDEEARVEIAKLCAKQNGRGTSQWINNFAIANETAKIAIAKLCAQQNGGGTASIIANFAIKDERARIEIAKLCAQQNGSETAEYIHNFNLESPHSLYELYLHCVEADPRSLFHGKLIHLEKGLTNFPLMIGILQEETTQESRRKELFEQIRGFIETLSISKENQKIILDMNSKIQALPPRVQNPAGLWLLSSLLLMREMELDAVGWLLESGIWSELGLLKDPGLRVSLSSGLRVLSAEGARTKLWGIFTSNVRGIQGQRGLILLALPFINLKLQGIEEGKLFAVANHLSALQRKKKSSLRNVHQVKNLLHTIHSLASINELTIEQKQCGFEKIFFEHSKSPNALIDDEQQLLKNVIAAKGLLQLKDTQWPNATENLNTLFRSSFEKLIPLEKYEGDASTKYEEIFAKCRNPSGLLSYAAGLKTLQEPALLSSLGQYVVWVMENTFKNNRYDTRDNPHLSKVLEGNPELLSVWKEEIQIDVDTLISGNKKEETFDSEKWLHTKLIVDKHLGGSNLSYLIKYFKEPSAEARKEMFSALTKEIKELLSTLSTSRATDPILTNLNLQKACLRLALRGKVDKKTVIKHLEEIDEMLHHPTDPNAGFHGSEFATDVKGLLEAFRKEAENTTETKGHLQAVFTDDPIDLLLCGTDVSGSCQRLDGDPNFNKGLLGYLIDGKNRLLAIKDGNKIMARCILRLLWDGEQPVVYRERFYPDQISSAEKEALNGLAKLIAQKLAVPLTCGEGYVPYNNTLQALGGPAPYEYCDGAGGVQKDGTYTIKAKILEIVDNL